MSHFVSTEWLARHLDDQQVVVVDGTWHLPNSGRNAGEEFLLGHIPGAVRFDVDAIADPDSGLPHTLPRPAEFARMVGELGIGSGMTIVVYDEYGLFSAPRVWWTLRVMGATDVKILEGGGPKWRAEHRPIEAGPGHRQSALFTPKFDSAAVTDFDATRDASASGTAQILDARPAARYSGEQPEPRPGLRAGHIPNSRNVPFTTLIENGTLKSESDLRTEFDKAGVTLDRPVITSCGSGVTAATLALALDIVGARQVKLYDGSWAEWGGRDDAPVATGSGDDA
jgi:thiosulfate/3-mercaptopyruvate sulfurtransferase